MARFRKKRSNIFPIFIIIALIWAIYIFFTYKNCISQPLFGSDSEIEITAGMTFASLTQKASCPSWTYKTYLHFNPPSFQLKKWLYKIQWWTTIKTLFSQLQEPINDDIKVTLLEGWNIYDIDATLTKKWLIQSWEFLTSIEKNLESYKKDFPFLNPAKSLEWFLYPDTYYINIHTFTIENFTKKLLNNFKQRVMENIDFWSNENVYKVVNLASIVEKEEKVKSQKVSVAWILEKRIKEWWMIWADATVCYPYKITSDECTPSFIYNHIADKNGYNTRTMLWLPETPISNPSFETIQATVDGDDTTPYYFYLHDSQGNIHFAKTNAEHEENKRKYIN